MPSWRDLTLRLLPDAVPAFTSDGYRPYFYALTAHPSARVCWHDSEEASPSGAPGKGCVTSVVTDRGHLSKDRV
jgi:hypothetical protein